MAEFKNISIKNKLILIQVATAFIAAMICSAFFLYNDIKTFKSSEIRNKKSIAEIVGVNLIPPLLFYDQDAANKICLHLNDNPSILNAVVLDKNGKEFARYTKKGAPPFSFPIPSGKPLVKQRFWEPKFVVSYRIFQEKEFLGTIMLRAELEDLNIIVYNYLKTAILILMFSIFSAFIISNFLQGVITNRLLSLVHSTREVAETGNYSLRVSAQGRDEIGVLSEGFNSMLEQIEKTQKALRDANLNLEERVKERTASLEETQGFLKLSEEKYRKLVEEAGDVVYTSDYKGYFTYINPMSIRLTGYKEHELIGKHFSEIIAPEWKEKVAKFYKEQFDNKTQETLFSFPIITKSGEKKWVEQTVIQQIAGDRIMGHQAIVRDITERKKAEEKLKEFQYFFYNSHDLITITNESHFEIINPNFQKVLDYSEKELLEKPFLDFIHPDDRSATLHEIEKLKTGGETINFRNRYRKKNGDYLLFEWNVTPDPITGKLYASARDITDRKKAEDELKNSEHFLNLIIENIPAMLFVKDAKDLRFVRFNKAGEDLLGYSKADLIGKNDYDFFPKTEADFFTAKDKKVLESGKLLEIEEEPIHTKYKGDRILETKKIPIIDNNGHPLYLLGISNDITDFKKLLAELKQKSEELARSNQELEQFAYVASHDLQEPLRTIYNFVGLLDKKYSEKTDQDTREYFKFIVNATAKMQNLIKDLLEFSRVGKNISFTDVDCNKILKEVIADLDVSIKESNAKIISAILPVLRGNEIELKRLFQNLISNAIKFHKKNVFPEITVTVEEKEKEYLFAIKDNGIGIEEKYIGKLFIIFQRLHSVEEYPGTGIGLATCKKIVTLHKGKIWVESKLDEGSTFYFTLPKEN